MQLSDAGELLDKTPACSALLHAWMEWANGTTVPIVENVRPELIGVFIPRVTVFNLDIDGTMAYSLASGRQRDLMNRDLRGSNLLDFTRPEDREERLRRTRPVNKYPCGMLSQGDMVRKRGGVNTYTSLALPVRVELGKTPSKAYLAIDDNAGVFVSDKDPIYIIPLAKTVIYIDLGFGAPPPI